MWVGALLVAEVGESFQELHLITGWLSFVSFAGVEERTKPH
jgi:hypothetical protein